MDRLVGRMPICGQLQTQLLDRVLTISNIVGVINIVYRLDNKITNYDHPVYNYMCA